MGEVGIPAIKLSPASLQHLLWGCAGGDGMQRRESGRLTGSAEILEERDRDGMRGKIDWV